MAQPTSAAANPPLLTRNFGLLVTAHFIQAVGWSSMLLFPLYLNSLGASRSEIGAIMGSAAVGGLMLRPLIGWGLDAWGRKPMLFVGTTVAGLAMGGIALVDGIDATVYIVRFVFGLGVAALFTGYFTFCTDLVPVARRTEGIALFGVSGLLPLLVNPAAEHYGVRAGELAWFLPAVGGVMLLSLVPLVPISEPPRTAASARPGLAEILRALRRRELWPVWIATCIFASIVMLTGTFATVAAEARGIGRPATYWLTYAGGSVFVRLIGARLPDRLGTRNMVGPSLAIATAGALAMAGVQDLVDLQLAGLLGGIGHGYAFPVLTSQVAERTPESVRGSAMAMFTALWDVAFLAVPPLFGALADARGDGYMFSAAGLLATGALVVWIGAEHRWGRSIPAVPLDYGSRSPSRQSR